MEVKQECSYLSSHICLERKRVENVNKKKNYVWFAVDDDNTKKW